MAAFGDFERGVRGFEIRLGGDAPLDEGGDALALPARFVHGGPRLADKSGLIGVNRVAIAIGIEAEARPRLLQGGIGLAQAKLEVGRRQAGDHVAFPHDRSEIDAQLLDAAGDLEAEGDLLLGGKRAADGHAAGERLQLEAQDFDRSGGGGGGVTRRRRRGAAAACRDRDGDDRNEDNSRTHNATCSPDAARTTSASRLWRQ